MRMRTKTTLGILVVVGRWRRLHRSRQSRFRISRTALSAQTSARPVESGGRTAPRLASTRYSPLDQINAGNFGTLEVAWRLKTDNLGPRPEFNFQSTPLMVGGVLYTTAGSRRAVVALDATTGEMKWMHSLDEGKRGQEAPRQLSGRGLAYWSDGRSSRIIYVTPGYQMIALDAQTGQRITSFGKGGIVDLKLEDDQEMDPITGDIGLHAAPIVVKDIVIIGAAHTEGSRPVSRRNDKGYVRGTTSRPASGSGSSTRSHAPARWGTTPGSRVQRSTRGTTASGAR